MFLLKEKIKTKPKKKINLLGLENIKSTALLFRMLKILKIIVSLLDFRNVKLKNKQQQQKT